MNTARAGISVLLLLLLSGCFGVDEANQHLASMETSTARMAESTQALKQSAQAANDKMDAMEKDMGSMRDELMHDRQYLASLTGSLQTLSDAAVAIQKMGGDVVKSMRPLTEATPDPKIKSPDELLGLTPPTEGTPK